MKIKINNENIINKKTIVVSTKNQNAKKFISMFNSI